MGAYGYESIRRAVRVCGGALEDSRAFAKRFGRKVRRWAVVCARELERRMEGLERGRRSFGVAIVSRWMERSVQRWKET